MLSNESKGFFRIVIHMANTTISGFLVCIHTLSIRILHIRLFPAGVIACNRMSIFLVPLNRIFHGICKRLYFTITGSICAYVSLGTL